jgi:hypothetical protein
LRGRGAAALEGEPVEDQHPLEVGDRPTAADDDPGHRMSGGHQRRRGAAEAETEHDDPRRIHPGRSRQALEGVAVVSHLGVVVELMAGRPFAVAAGGALDADEDHAGALG